MATVYCDSNAGGAGTGADWANAYTTLQAGLTGAGVGGTVYVAHNHAETSGAAALTLTSPGTLASPTKAICVDSGGTVPPVSADLRTTARVIRTGSNDITLSTGILWIYGITFEAANSLRPSCNGWELKDCGLKLTGTGGNIVVSGLNLRLINPTLTFSNAAQAFFASANGSATVLGGAAAGTAPTGGFFKSTGTVRSSFYFDGFDLSFLTTNPIAAAIGGEHSFILRNCKIGTGTVTTPTALLGAVDQYNSDSADTNYRLWLERYAGSIKSETTLVKTGGASDGDTPLSWKMASSANAEYPMLVLRSPEIFSERITSVGSAKTITVDILHDSATALKDDEIWLEVQYLGTSGVPLGAFADDAKADVLATGADQTASSATWTTTGMANPNKQKLEVTFTPQEKGVAIVTVCMAKASYTVYVDPFAQLGSSGTERSFQIPGAGQINTVASAGSGGVTRARLPSGLSGVG